MSPDLDREDVALLQRLPDQLLRAGYFDAYCVYGALHVRLAQVRRQLGALPAGLRTLVRLFMLSEAMERDALRGLLSSPTIDALLRLGVLVADGESLSTAGLALLPFFGQMVLVPSPTGQGLIDDAGVLAARVSPPPGARCLDLYAGTGMKSLRCLAVGRSVVAVEMNPILTGYVEINFAMNGVAERGEVLGHIDDAVARGGRFDYVVANPPILAFPPHLLSPAAHPADDGMVLYRRVLARLPELLAEDGWAQFLVCCAGDEGGPHLRRELTSYAREFGAHVAMTVPARARMCPGDPFFEDVAHESAVSSRLKIDEVRERIRASFLQSGTEYLYGVAITVSLEAARAGVTSVEQFREPGGFWFK